MNKKIARPFKNRILLSILLPVLAVGVILCMIATSLITPPISDSIRARIDSELTHMSGMALQICENHLNYLLDLRLEDDREMNAALQREAGEEIKRLASRFQGIHMLVLRKDGALVAVSEKLTRDPVKLPLIKPMPGGDIRDLSFWGNPVRAHYLYFPFWDWYLVGYINESDYQAPLILARRIILSGTFGLLGAIWLVLLVVVNRLISSPLKRLADATRKVAEGNLSELPNLRRDEIGQVVEAFNTMVGGLERKNKEVSELIAALKESEKRYRELFDSAAEGILVTEVSTGRIRYANPAICRMLGYSEATLVSMTMLDIHPPDEAVQILADLAEQLHDTGKSMAADIACVRRDGGTIFADIKATAVVIDGLRCNLGFFTDVTARHTEALERRELENQLHRSEKMEAIGLLAGGVAHDLNNILSGLVSYPELLLLDLPAESPLRHPIKTIENSGKRAAAIVQDLLTLARRGVAISQVTNLNRIVTEYLHAPEHEKLAKHHPNAVIEVHLDDRLMDVKGSPVHLSKTVMNLVSNAFEAVDPARGLIRLSTRNQYVERPVRGYDEVRQGDYAVLSVADDGIGIAPKDLKRIFEPFYSKKVMGRSGTGLGMAVVWGTVKDHNGYIDVESTPNRGTTFELYIPITRELRADDAETGLIQNYRGDGQTILVVDDFADQREIATRILEYLGYRVDSVVSGEAAVEYMRTGRADLLILDMIMDPGMDGLDTYREILKFHPGQKAIIASGFSENDRVREAQRLGARQYIKKPYSLEAIGMAVKAGLE
ncbi:ATP-binding protein [Desulfosarcina sp.]|uniref:ATP-binding protein n=1 Tax=Desulfosarcina sp. TaxID=2027861 RepID=UPI003970CBEE